MVAKKRGTVIRTSSDTLTGKVGYYNYSHENKRI